ncbi:N-acetylglucosamine kinase [Janibacter melonis]|nr:BadF/BadG/BcrA/BcrD ATPase family protein [Janibacter melonis]
MRCLAVDVGGSGLRVTWAGERRGPVGRSGGVRLGPTGIDSADLVERALALAGDVDDGRGEGVDRLVWSTRGLMLQDPGPLREMLVARTGCAHVAIVSDAVGSLVGALGAVEPGAVVAAGTGAVAFATDLDATWRRVDGWGHVLGDEGSSAWLGLAGMRAALRAVDDRPRGSRALLDAARELLGEPATWPRQTMTGPHAPALLGSMAPAVTAAADGGDEVAAELCARAGTALACSLLDAAAGLPDVPLTAVGGLLGAARVRAALEEEVARHGRVLRPAAGDALDGARLLALRWRTHQLPHHEAHLRSAGAPPGQVARSGS